MFMSDLLTIVKLNILLIHSVHFVTCQIRLSTMFPYNVEKSAHVLHVCERDAEA